MYTRKANATREAPWRGQSNDQLEAREGQAGRLGVAERFVVPLKLGNAGGGKGPQFKTDAIRGEGPGRLGIKRPIRCQKTKPSGQSRYGSDGYMKSDDITVNGHNVKLNPDGTFTAYFGSKGACGDVPNRLDI